MNKPFLLRPTGKDYLWGGNKLNDEFEKHIELSPLAETWECSTHPDGPSYVVSGEFEGQSLSQVLKEHPEFLGSHPNTEGELPILVKLIDARQDLSVQVHPDDDYACEHEGGQLGKTEMWYVLSADEDASLIYGFNKNVSKDQVRDAALKGQLMNHLQKVPVKKGDLFFIKAGTVHAIGAGTVVAEVQENSNLTYRLYDFDRVDRHGNKRELHIDKALSVMNLNKSMEPRQPMRIHRYEPGVARELLCSCKYFEVYRMMINTQRRQVVNFKADDVSFRVLLCVGGCAVMDFQGGTLQFYKGDCIFVPADSVPIKISGQAQLLDIRG